MLADDLRRQQGDHSHEQINPLSRNAPYLFFITGITPDNYTRQWGSSAV